MKSKVILVILSCFFVLTAFPKKVSHERAKKIAENWGNMKLNLKSNKIKDRFYCEGKKDTTIYVFNFEEGGCVLVSADENTCPILAYSHDKNLNLTYSDPIVLDWLSYCSDMIESNKKEKQLTKVKQKWDEIENNAFLKSTQTSVPSLLESSGSSRWAGWTPYCNQAPEVQPLPGYHKGHNSCVPIAMSQLMKYYQYPLIGTGYGSAYNNGSKYYERINSFLNYDLMPFRLTYCGAGRENCNDGSWSIIPDVTQAQIDEVGKLNYMAGLAVEMWWLGLGDPEKVCTGVPSLPNDWATALSANFFYSSNFDYWDDSGISENTSGFKAALRNSLENGYPALFCYASHAILIDGYENEDYFHFIMGCGGDADFYYYLFSDDEDGIHLPRPQIEYWRLNSSLNIHPDCPPSQDQTVSGVVISDGEGELIQSGNNLTISNTTIESGGRAVLRADNEIIVTSNFEVELGGEILIVSKPCSN